VKKKGGELAVLLLERGGKGKRNALLPARGGGIPACAAFRGKRNRRKGPEDRHQRVAERERGGTRRSPIGEQ